MSLAGCGGDILAGRRPRDGAGAGLLGRGFLGTTIVTPSVLDAAKDALRGYAASLDGDMGRASAALRASWSAWYRNWLAKINGPSMASGWFGLGPKMDQLESDEKQLDLWNTKLGGVSTTPLLGSVNPSADLLSLLGGWKMIAFVGAVVGLVVLAPAIAAVTPALAMKLRKKEPDVT